MSENNGQPAEKGNGEPTEEKGFEVSIERANKRPNVITVVMDYDNNPDLKKMCLIFNKYGYEIGHGEVAMNLINDLVMSMINIIANPLIGENTPDNNFINAYSKSKRMGISNSDFELVCELIMVGVKLHGLPIPHTQETDCPEEIRNWLKDNIEPDWECSCGASGIEQEGTEREYCPRCNTILAVR